MPGSKGHHAGRGKRRQSPARSKRQRDLNRSHGHTSLSVADERRRDEKLARKNAQRGQ